MKILQIQLLFIFIKLNHGFSDSIPWKNASFDIKKADKNSIIGLLMAKINDGNIFYFQYEFLKIPISNKICGLLGYDEFHSFSFEGYIKEPRLTISFQNNSFEI